jgi:hypothetical protein
MRKFNLMLTVLFVILAAFYVAKQRMVFSGEFTSTSATLNNARLSFSSALEGAQTVGSSLVIMDTTNFPSTSVLQLQARDAITINGNPYTVATTIDDTNDDTFNLTSGLGVGDVTNDMAIYGLQTSTLTVRLTTISALAGGSFRILVPATSDTGTDHDDIPDDDGFDFGSGTPATVTCPTGPVSYGTWSDTATPADTSTIVMDGIYYHLFECAYTGTGAVGTDFGTTYDAFVINDLINPSPSSTHTLGQADTYSVIIQQLDSSATVIDQTVTKIGVVDAVKVSASIAPQLTFTIAGINSGVSACGVNTDVTTTALTVPFGGLTIAAFVDAAQKLTVTTNALNGYAVTVAENDQVSRGGLVCTSDTPSNTCIADATVAGASHTTSADWTDPTDYGFGYSIGAVTSGVTPAFYYNESSRTFSAKHFADLEHPEVPQVIFSRGTVASNDQADVCYRIAPAATNVAGNYENYLVYTASATF